MQYSGQFESKSKKAAIRVTYFSVGGGRESHKRSTSNSLLFCLEKLPSAPEATAALTFVLACDARKSSGGLGHSVLWKH